MWGPTEVSAGAKAASRDEAVRVLTSKTTSVGPSQATIEGLHIAFIRDAVDRVEAGSGGSGYIQVAAGPEGQVVRRNRRFERRENEDLARRADGRQ